MKISKSKQELARIISENGGWRDGNYAVQDKDDKKVWFMRTLAGRPDGAFFWPGVKSKGIPCDKVLPNWHQAILSREEYFHLYPAPDAKTEFCESVMRSIPEPSDNPTIEQLAADYRNAKDCAERKRKEADVAKADAEAKLAELVDASKELGLIPASAVKPAIDGCMQLVDMVPTRLQSHQEESVAAIGYVVNVERLYDKVRYAFDLLK